MTKILTWIGIILFIIAGAFSIYVGVSTKNYGLIGEGVVFVALCPVLCWLSSLITVGFGKLIETIEEMKDKMEEIDSKISNK